MYDYPDNLSDLKLAPASGDYASLVLTTWGQVFLTGADFWPLGEFISKRKHIAALDLRTRQSACRFVKSDIDPRLDDSTYQRVIDWQDIADAGCRSTKRAIQEFGFGGKVTRVVINVLAGATDLRPGTERLANLLRTNQSGEERFRLERDAMRRAANVLCVISTGTSKRHLHNPNGVPRIAQTRMEPGEGLTSTGIKLHTRGVCVLPLVHVPYLLLYRKGMLLRRHCKGDVRAMVKKTFATINSLGPVKAPKCWRLFEEHAR